MKIVGFGYRKGVGKDFCTDYLVRKYGFRRISFADPLKHALEAIFGFSHEQLYGDQKEAIDPHWNFSTRWAMQRVGTETMREFFGALCVQAGFWPSDEINNIWVKAAVRYLRKLREEGVDLVAFSDVRFLNEFQVLRKEGAALVKIIRPPELLDDPTQSTHASEAELDDLPDMEWDLVLRNIGDDYIEVLDSLMTHLEIPPVLDR